VTPAPLPDPPHRPRTARLATIAGVTLGTAAVCALVTAPTAAAAPSHHPTPAPAHSAIDAPAHSPTAAPAHDRTAAPADHQIAAAASYVAALVDHNPSSVPLHPTATRVENGVPTGFSGPQIRFDLEHGPQYRVIQRVRDERYRRTGATVTADYLLDIGVGVGAQLATARVHETFELVNGLIKTIVADIAATPSVPAP
jgi:hypothetical protein